MADSRQKSRQQRILLIIVCMVLLVASCVFFSKVSAAVGATDSGSLCHIYFKDSGIVTDDASKVLIDGNKAVCGKGGSYTVTGTGIGQIIVDTADTQPVELTFSDLNLTCEEDAAFLVRESGDVIVHVEGDNYLADGNFDVAMEERAKACFYSKSDVKLVGDGALTVIGHYHHGISVRGDLYSELSRLSVSANVNAIDTNDSFILADGKVLLEAACDGINALNKEDSSKGTVDILGGVIDINSGDEGIQAGLKISVKGGHVNAKSVGQIFKCDGELDIDSQLVTAVVGEMDSVE